MEKIKLTQIDQENWRFILYESQSGNWYGDFDYSPISFVDSSILIEFTEKEKRLASENRDYLIELSESIRKNYKDYEFRSLSPEAFEFD